MAEIFVAIALAAVFALMFAPFGDWTIKHGRYLRLQALVWTRLRSTRVRVSCSALLKISEDSACLLARMFRRQDAFGPFGGAYKTTQAAVEDLANVGFEAQALGLRGAHGIDGDLRGYVIGSRLPAFLEWFDRGVHRESDRECLRRELGEELGETGCEHLTPLVEALEFRFLREVREGPEILSGAGIRQLRIFRIYELNLDHGGTRTFRDQLLKAAKASEHLILANSTQIRNGRAEGRSIGHHAGYLLGQRRVRPDLPPFDC